MRQVSCNTLQQVEKFKYLGGYLRVTEGGARRWIHGLINLREFYRSVFTKWELSNTVKLSVCKSVFVPILTYGRDSWVMTEIILTQVQVPKMGFLRRGHCVTKGHTEVRLRPGQETSLALPYLNLRPFGSKCTALKRNLRLCWDFLAPLSDSAPGALCPLVTPILWHYRDKLRSCETRRALNVEPLLRIERTQVR